MHRDIAIGRDAALPLDRRASRIGPRRGRAVAVSLPPRRRCRQQPHRIPMSDTPPDRLAMDPRSPYHDAALLDRGVGVRFNGQERDNVEEYSVSEGWIRVQVGRSRDRRGNPMTIKVKGTVEPYFLKQD
jgi:hypothetical protein